MEKLITGLHQFQSQVFPTQRALFKRLSRGQAPDALFITCSDSRINPNLLTQTDPGELFILRNAGNIVPKYGTSNGGEAATIEFAIGALNIRNIIVCGHSHCGAVQGLFNPQNLEGLPAVAEWLGHSADTRHTVETNYKHLSGDQLINVGAQENVLTQLENLRTHPIVAARLASGDLKLHGWMYKIETGAVFTYHPLEGQFLPATAIYPVPKKSALENADTKESVSQQSAQPAKQFQAEQLHAEQLKAEKLLPKMLETLNSRRSTQERQSSKVRTAGNK